MRVQAKYRRDDASIFFIIIIILIITIVEQLADRVDVLFTMFSPFFTSLFI